MKQQEFRTLLLRIDKEPSILLLGQKYLAGNGGKTLWEEVGAALGAKIENCYDMYDALQPKKSKALTPAHLDPIREVSRSISAPDWLSDVLCQHWDGVMTSSLDGVLLRSEAASRYHPAEYRESAMFRGMQPQRPAFTRKLFSKQTPSYLYLYHCLERDLLHTDNAPDVPINPDAPDQDRVNWYLSCAAEYVRYYGCLVVDGWDLREDMDLLSLTQMADMFHEVETGSVYVFGCDLEKLEEQGFSREQKRILNQLRKDGNVIFEKDTFCVCLLRAIAEGDWEIGDRVEEPALEVSGFALTLENRTHIISRASIDSLDPAVTLLTDETLKIPAVLPANRRQAFLMFLTDEESEPYWKGYASEFYIGRNVDKPLKEAVRSHLKDTSHRKPVVLLAGGSNSGKSATLKNLSYSLWKEHLCPVLYIRGDMYVDDDQKALTRFVRETLLNLPNNRQVVIVWDNNHADIESYRQYTSLRNRLGETHVLVVGSSYRTDIKQKHLRVIPMDDSLEKDESDGLKRLLESFGGGEDRRFRLVNERLKQGDRRIPLFLALKRFSEFDEAFSSVNHQYSNHLSDEAQLCEQYCNRLFDSIHYGPAEQLQRLIIEKKAEGDGATAAESERFLFGIHRINQMLALAGQYGLALPLGVLSGTFTQSCANENTSIELLNALRYDLITALRSRDLMAVFDAQNGTVCFRHRVEAEMYLDNELPPKGTEDRLKAEISLLIGIISSADWYSDDNYSSSQRQVLQLIYRFTPSNPEAKTIEEENRYKEYFGEIAECLLEFVATRDERSGEYTCYNVEGCRIAANLLREQLNTYGEHSSYIDELLPILDKAFALLKAASKVADESRPELASWSKQQITLRIEMAANRVQTLPLIEGCSREFSSEESYRYRQVLEQLREVCRHMAPRIESLGSCLRLLDTWVNAFEKRTKSKRKASDTAFDGEMLEMIQTTDTYLPVIYQADLIEKDKKKLDSTLKKLMQNVFIPARKLAHADELLNSFTQKGRDTGIYFRARSLWPEKDSDLQKSSFYTSDVQVKDTLCPEEVLKAAKETVIYFEGLGQREKQVAMRSGRCLLLWLRSSWIKYTGQMPFTEKQRPALTESEWVKLENLCRAYESRASDLKEECRNVFPFFLRMVYRICRSSENIREIRKDMRIVADKLKTGELYYPNGEGVSSQNYTILYYVEPGHKEPASFNFNIRRNEQNRLKDGRIVSGPIERLRNCSGSGGEYISAYVAMDSDGFCRYFDINPSASDYHSSQHPCALGFNLTGPVVAIPPARGGKKHE